MTELIAKTYQMREKQWRDAAAKLAPGLERDACIKLADGYADLVTILARPGQRPEPDSDG